MSISPTQVVAASGLSNGVGLSVSSEMVTAFNTFDSKPIVTIINNMFAGTANTVSNVSGLQTSINNLPKWVTGRHGNIKISGNAYTRANLLIPNTANGVKTFCSYLSMGGAFTAIVSEWNASINKFQNKEFQDLGLQNTNYNELASGGLIGYFSDLKDTPGGIKSGLQALSLWIRQYGYAVNYNGNLSQAFGPKALIFQLRNFNLGDIGSLNSKLSAIGLSSNSAIKAASDSILISVLKEINNQTDLNVIRTQLSISVSLNAIPTQQTLADYVIGKNVLPTRLQNLTKETGFITDLNNNVGGLNGNFSTPDQLSEFISKIEVPEYSNLNTLEKPVPDSVVNQFSPKIGRGTLPTLDNISESLGTGPVKNPTIVDLFGSAGGVRYTEAYKEAAKAHDYIATLSEGTSLTTALQNVYTADKTPPYTVSGTLITSLNNAITNFNTKIQNDIRVKTAANLIVKSALQNIREVTLHPLAEIDLTKPPPSMGTIGPLIIAQSLSSYGADKSGTGHGELLYNMANLTTATGEAIRASLQEGKNSLEKDSKDIPNNINATAAEEIKNVNNSNKGKLTDQQRSNIIAEAKKNNLDPDIAIANAEKFGYDNQYYIIRGYPSA